MQYITEEEAKKRFEARAECRLAANERLTPAAAEYLRARNCQAMPIGAHALSFQPASSIPVPAEAKPVTACAPIACSPCIGRTFLDANTQVHKSHARIELRGRLDTLLAACLVVQTQFDVKSRLPALLKQGIADVNTAILQMLGAELSGEAVGQFTVCDMDMAALHSISLDPQKYLHQDHVFPNVSLGPNMALLNWLRALVREMEVAFAKMGDRDDLLEFCNRLSSAVYVLMLLTLLAEQGRDISKVQKP